MNIDERDRRIIDLADRITEQRALISRIQDDLAKSSPQPNSGELSFAELMLALKIENDALDDLRRELRHLHALNSLRIPDEKKPA